MMLWSARWIFVLSPGMRKQFNRTGRKCTRGSSEQKKMSFPEHQEPLVRGKFNMGYSSLHLCALFVSVHMISAYSNYLIRCFLHCFFQTFALSYHSSEEWTKWSFCHSLKSYSLFVNVPLYIWYYFPIHIRYTNLYNYMITICFLRHSMKTEIFGLNCFRETREDFVWEVLPWIHYQLTRVRCF